MAPQPLGLSGPMAQGHLMTTEIQDADLILHQALLMNMREVTSCYGSHVNSTALEFRSGSILFGKGPTYQSTVNLSQLIARQVPCRPGFYLKQEANKGDDNPLKLTVPFAAPKQLSQSANPNHLKTERSASNSRLCGECWLINSKKFLFLDGDDGAFFFVPALDARSQVLSIHLSSQHGHCVMAVPSPHRFSATWRVEALISAVSLSDGFYTLRSLCLVA